MCVVAECEQCIEGSILKLTTQYNALCFEGWGALLLSDGGMGLALRCVSLRPLCLPVHALREPMRPLGRPPKQLGMRCANAPATRIWRLSGAWPEPKSWDSTHKTLMWRDETWRGGADLCTQAMWAMEHSGRVERTWQADSRTPAPATQPQRHGGRPLAVSAAIQCSTRAGAGWDCPFPPEPPACVTAYLHKSDCLAC